MLKKLSIIALAVLTITGCKKDPKNVGPTNSFSTSTYPKTVNDLQTVLVSAYANMRDPGLYGFWFMPKALSNSMHTINSVYNGDPAWNEMANTNLTAGNNYAGAAWAAFYTGVKDCNVTIYAADQLTKLNPNMSASDKQAVNAILGQAYCLRGWYYMELECLYGESYMGSGGTNGDKMGVPLYNGLPTDLNSTQVARASVKDTWDFIINDFKQAQTLLHGQTWNASNAARVTEWTAEGLLGKAYVYTQDWANAKTALNDVITKSGKTLMPFNVYANAFNGQNKFNSESLFELYIDPDTKGGYGVYSGAANSASINGLIWSTFTFGGYHNGGTPFNGTVNDIQPLGYGNEFFHDKNVTRFGYPLGSAFNLVNNPNYKPATGPTFFNQQQIMDPTYKQQALAVRTNKTADPRLYINAMQPWIDSVKFDGSTWALVAEPGQFAGNPNVYGWAVKKYAPIAYNEGNGQGSPAGNVADAWDYYILRLADIYLLYAEACANSGDNVNGLEYLNKVKRRAYDLPIDAPSAIDYVSLSAQTSALNDPVLGHNPLYYERWAELFNEGSWWFDVCRWKIGKSEATFYGTAANLNGPINWDDNKSYVWPIPLSEMNSNAKAKQNPGY